MPQIPLSNKAGMIRHTPDTVPMTGAPGMDHGMDEARALARFGERIGQTGLHLGDAMLRFANATRDAEDRLAEREYLTAYAEHEGELEKRMAENPGLIEQFGAWAEEADKEWGEKEKPYLDRMSEGRRNLFAEHMRAVRAKSLGNRMRISLAASATRQRQGFLDNFTTNCRREDWDGALATLDAARDVLSPAEIGKFRDQIPGLREEADLRHRITSGDYEGVIGEVSADKYAGHLSPEKRRGIRHDAEQQRYRTEREQDDAFAARIAAGEDVPTQGFLQQLHELGDISDRQFAKWSAMIRSYDAAERGAENAGTRAKHAAARERAARVLVADILEKAVPNEREVYDRLWKACGGDVFVFLEYRQRFAALVKEKKTPKDNLWTTEEGKVVEAFIKDQFNTDQLVYDKGSWWSGDDSAEFQAQQYLDLRRYARARLLANQMNVEKTIAECRTQIAKLQDGKIRRILDGTVRDAAAKTQEGKNGK